MKIIYLHQYFNTPEMSGGVRSFEMARRIVAKGHTIEVVTSLRDQNSSWKGWKTTSENGITVHWYSLKYSNHMSYPERIVAFFLFAFVATIKAMKLKGDVIFATSTPLTISIPAIFAAKYKKIPMIFEVRDLWPEVPIAIGALKNPILICLARILEAWAYKHSDAIVTLSPAMKAGVVARGYSPDKTAIIPNASDNDMFKSIESETQAVRFKRKWLGSDPFLIYAGTIGRINGISYLAELASELMILKSKVKILIVGDGVEVEQVRHKAIEYGVYENNFFMEPMIPKNEISPILSAATMASQIVIDLPEARANSANKFFDALAAEKPVFINHGGWLHDLVVAKNCGFSAWGFEINDAAKKLDQLMNDPQWLAETAKNSSALAHECFDRDFLASRLLSVFSLVLEGRGGEVYSSSFDAKK